MSTLHKMGTFQPKSAVVVVKSKNPHEATFLVKKAKTDKAIEALIPKNMQKAFRGMAKVSLPGGVVAHPELTIGTKGEDDMLRVRLTCRSARGLKTLNGLRGSWAA